jgi:hypothetical protein
MRTCKGNILIYSVKIDCGSEWNSPESYHSVKSVILWNTNEDRVREDSSHQGYNDAYINTYRRFGGDFDLHLHDIIVCTP